MTEIRTFKTSALQSTEEGLSGASRIGLPPIAGLTAAEVETAIRELAAGVGATPASPTTLGTIKLSQAAADPNNPMVPENTDPRLSDARTSTAHKVSHATGGTDALTPADIGASTDGHSHAQLHDRNHNLFSTDHPDVDEADVPAEGQVLTYNGTSGKWEARPAGGTPSATETVEGTVEHATAAEITAGTAGNLVPTAARLKAELDTRVVGIPLGGPTVLSAVTVPTTGTTSGDLRGLNGVASDARGVFLQLNIGGQGGSLKTLSVDSADVTPGGNSPTITHNGTGALTDNLPVPLGTGVNVGKITFIAGSSFGSTANVSAWVTGYWR